MLFRTSLALVVALSIFLPFVSSGEGPDSAPIPTTLKVTQVVGGFSAVTDIQNAGDARLFVVQQGGQIRIVKNGALLATPFLDISARLVCCSERGLLGLAFHPQYASNGYFYVNYTYLQGGTALRSRISRFTRSAGNADVADPNSERILLEFSQPYTNHNGGALHFGPDGYLYITSGDGGDSYDPSENSQNTGVPLGKILRIDVNATTGGDCNLAGGGNYGIPAGNPLADGAGGACDEIWAYGLRNPWRISFDRQTGDLWIADVGQGAREEIDFQPAGSAGGQNYGWDCWEGTVKNNTDPSPACASNPPTVVAPIHEYDHGGGKCSITGGYVYRGPSYAGYTGAYFFADYCSDEVWTLRRTTGSPIVTKLTVSGATLNEIRTFGQDAAGELYIGTSTTVYRIEDPNGAAVAPALSISDAAGTQVTLNWSGNAANCNYEVHKGASPYFAPAGLATEVATIASTAPLMWSDPNGTGNVNVSNYYLTRAFNCSSVSGADSNRVGEFEFQLAQGT